ncbi:uncharacterized protein LOC134250178 [Saccostrea cucullata]|uniref:uncharacterized protein LOC134250178 n=1 Tax=Saccostrea cuccullata TaxID=36930 RepID=UPI002ED2FFD3
MIDAKHVQYKHNVTVDDFGFGIVEVYLDFIKQTAAGTEQILKSSTLRNFTVKNIPPLFSIEVNETNSEALHNGNRFCLKYRAYAGGYVVYRSHTYIYGKTEADRMLCYFFDNLAPKHCSDLIACNSTPLNISKEVTNSSELSVTFLGWKDYDFAGAKTIYASGIQHFEIFLHEMEYDGLKLKAKHSSVLGKIQCSNCTSFSIHIPATSNPMLYSVVLEVVDIALNSRQARRFVLFDNSSKILSHSNKALSVISASVATGYVWQTNHRTLCYDWTGKYYNDKYVHYNPMSPIDPGVHNTFSGIYEQTSGHFRPSGTPNVRGITHFKYKVAKRSDGQFSVLSTDQMIPNILNEGVCVNISNLKDGDEVYFELSMGDVVENELSDNVTVFIDESPPVIRNVWLIRDEQEMIYVHNQTDISKMNLTFQTFDIHSGLDHISWTAGWTENQEHFANKILGVKPIQACDNGSHCYCTPFGYCARYNFSLDLNSLVMNNTHIGQHHRNYTFEIMVTNKAKLQSKRSVVILIDESAPELGVIQEGESSKPDLDFTATENITISWKGFLDHESGIRFYRIAVSNSCIPKSVMLQKDLQVSFFETSETSLRATLPNVGKYFASIVAFNNALESSEVACSDGIVFDETPPTIRAVTVENLNMYPKYACGKDNNVWLITESIKKIKTNCTCTTLANNVLDIIPVDEKVNYTIDCSGNITTNEPLHFYLNNDRIYINWSILDDESSVHEVYVGFGSSLLNSETPDIIGYTKSSHKTFYHKRHLGLHINNYFYIFIKAENNALMETVVHIGPVLIDETPPTCFKKPEVVISDGFVTVYWNSSFFFDVNQIETVKKIFYRLGTKSQMVSTFSKWEEQLSTSCPKSYECLSLNLEDVQTIFSDTHEDFIFDFHVYNAAGLFCEIQSVHFNIPFNSQTFYGKLYDLNPLLAGNLTLKNMQDSNFTFSNSSFCVGYHGTFPQSDAVYEFAVNSNTSQLMYDKGNITVIDQSLFTYCNFNIPLEFFKQYTIAMKMTSLYGVLETKTNGFISIDQSDSSLNLTVQDGKGCDETTVITRISNTEFINNTVYIHPKLTIGHHYTLFVISNDFNYNISSKDVIISSVTTFKDFISFIPMEEHPSFIIEGLSENMNLSELILHKCIKDLELVQNMDKISANWKVHGPSSKFITSYGIAVHYSCSLQKNCNETILFRRNVEKTFSSSILTGPLRDGFYQVSIKPCFGDICSKSWKSNGFYIEKFDMNIGRLSASLDLLDNECPVVNIKFQRFVCSAKVKKYAVFYKWAFFGDNKGEKQLTTYKSVNAAVNDTISVSTCVHLPVYPHGELYLCVKGFCESGLSSLQCSMAWIKQHPNEFPKSVVYDLNLKTLPIENLDDYRFTSTIGSDMIKTLHKHEMDFTNKSWFQLGGFTIGTGRNHVQWTVMTEKRVPTDCLTDVSCIYQEITIGGFARFHTYLGLRTGEIYYLCVNVTKGCSDGFVIDNVPPSSGNVKVHNHHNGYINSNSTVTLLWHGFVDGSHFKEFLYPSAIERYEMAIGTHLNSQDVLSFTHCGLSESSVLTNVTLTNGMTYYFFIRAFDHAGNYITSSSDPYIFDSTPPTTGMVTVGSYIKSLTMVNPGNLIAHWSGMEDRESGIEKYELGIRSFNEQVSAYYSVNKNTYADLEDYFSFIDGHQYRINLKAWNNAGLYTTVSSAPFIFDASPPLVGIVRDGPLETGVDLMFSSNASSLSIHWTNFHDPHSMISNYRVGLGTAFKKTNIIPMTDVGLREEWTWFKSFRTGVKYFATVESCNKAGLCSGASSNGIILDDSPPIPGRVLVGRNNDRYVPDSKTLRVSWVDFIEAESGILQYFVCLGSKKFVCDVESWKNSRHESSILLFNLNLPQNQTIYATVKAENKAGLTSSASSDELFVDVTPPIVVFPPNVIKTNSPIELYDSSLLKIQWKFKDNESPLSKGLISFRTSHNSKLFLDDITFYGDDTRTISLDTSKWLSSGDKYRIVVTSCNAARLCTSSESDEITIDSTPPLVGHILDNAVWSNNDLSVMLKWKDFVDPETQVVAYHLHLSETLYGREISGQTIKVPHDGGVHEEQNVTVNITRKLVQNEKILLGLSATNNVGLNSKARHVTFLVLPTNNNVSQGRLLIEKHSCDSLSCTNDCTCSAIGKKCSNNIGIMQCRESNFTMKPLPTLFQMV